MGDTYQEYCAYMEERGWEPVIEEVWQREYAPRDTAQPEPVVMTATTAKVRPTLHAHEEQQPKKRRAATGRYRANGLSA